MDLGGSGGLRLVRFGDLTSGRGSSRLLQKLFLLFSEWDE